MALAFLCQQLKQQHPGGSLGRFSFQAFIVDHKARVNSDKQARRTGQRLMQMGLQPMSSSILANNDLSQE